MNKTNPIKSFELRIGDMQVDFVSSSNIFLTTTEWNAIIHFHSMFEFHYLSDGCVDIFFENRKTTTIHAGDACIIQPNHSHRIEQKSEYVTHATTSFSLKQIASIASREKSIFSEYRYYKGILDTLTEETVFDGQSLLPYIKTVNNLYAENTPAAAHQIEAYMTVYFIELCAQIQGNLKALSDSTASFADSGECGSLDAERRNIIEQYVSEFYMDDNHLEKMSKLLHLSISQTIRVVKQLTGFTLSELINRQRMLIAKHLISVSDMPFEQIASQIGFQSYNNFYICVMNYYHISPKELRRRSAASDRL